jgi:hypothetical protein
VRIPRLLASALSIAIGLLPIAAPEHVHDREDRGHAQVVVHRHMPPHALVEHHGEDRAALDHDDAPVLTLNTVYTVPGSVVLATPARSASALTEPPERQRIDRALTTGRRLRRTYADLVAAQLRETEMTASRDRLPRALTRSPTDGNRREP